MTLRRLGLLAAFSAAAVALSLAAPAGATQVQIDPAHNAVTCSGCSGAGAAATATAAAPTRTEGASGQPSSQDLHGSTRVLNMDSSGNPIDPNAAMPAGTNHLGGVNLDASTTGGCTLSGTPSAASTNATNVKASAGTLCGGLVINTTATVYYLRLYNLATPPTCSSSAGFVTAIPIPASATGAGTLLNFGSYGAAFSAGIAYCLTGGGSSTDNTNAATGVYPSLATK